MQKLVPQTNTLVHLNNKLLKLCDSEPKSVFLQQKKLKQPHSAEPCTLPTTVSKGPMKMEMVRTQHGVMVEWRSSSRTTNASVRTSSIAICKQADDFVAFQLGVVPDPMCRVEYVSELVGLHVAAMYVTYARIWAIARCALSCKPQNGCHCTLISFDAFSIRITLKLTLLNPPSFHMSTCQPERFLAFLGARNEHSRRGCA